MKYYEILIWCDVTIGGFESTNKKLKVKNSAAIWNNFGDKNDVSLQQILQNFPVEVAQIPDIFINLYT